MTPAQKFNFFMPAWNACCRSNGWHTRGGFAVVDEARLPEEGRKAVTFARQRARMRDGARAPQPFTLRDMHHGCYIVALGRDKDTDTLNNKEIDRIVALIRWLANPMDLKAVSNWAAYQRGEDPGQKVRTKHFIQSRAPEAVLRKLTFDLTSGRTRDPEALDDRERQELARLLAQRGIYGHRPRIQPAQAKPNPKNYVLNPQLVFTKGPF